MSNRWFRYYTETLRDPKVKKLSDKDFRLWVELLCVAADNDGHLPALDDLKHVLNRRLDHLSTAVKRLISGGLIIPLESGFAPNGWDKRQYKSDSSTERSRQHRAKRNVAETPPDTETDTETEKIVTPADAGSSSQYAFEAGVIRLTSKDLNRWIEAFPNINVRGELMALSEWAERQNKWFHAVSGALAKKDREMLERKANAASQANDNQRPLGYCPVAI